MNKILFSHSYFLRFDPKQWDLGRPYPPLGTLYAATLLKNSGFDVAVWDSMFAKHPNEIEPILEIEKPDIFVLYDDGFNYLTKMCLTNMREAAFEMCKKAKALGCIVIVSSSDATDHDEEYLHQGADFILHGEGELSLLELVQTLIKGKIDLSAVKGISYWVEKEIFKTPARTILRNLDSLPMPDWSLISLIRYRQLWMKNAGYFSMNMCTTRGCPYKCNWCAKPIYGNRYNSRSPKNVVQEIRYLKEVYSIDHIWFCDDIFGLRPVWVEEFVAEMELEKVTIHFKIQSRADLLVDEKLVKGLSRAGCEEVWIGAESGSQKILDAMDKGITLSQIQRATTLMKNYGIRPCFFIQFGYLGESKQDIDNTIQMITSFLPEQIGISVSYPLPGTIFYDKVRAELITKTNWTDSNEMSLMFKNTFSARFYKQLYRFVHHHYRKHRAAAYWLGWWSKPFRLNLVSFKALLSLLYFTFSSFLEKIKLDRLEKTSS